ncbi:hypothetical protein DFP72DRAFT_398185 [Ephemerocybe angulata]|uniref:Uncharacterized protein n=1 Tax=Ephemerocybe angulata TaxID=980116 RepID=A0A8H6LRC9_9AGAR|nr:hypothetical protein DFP72DRAFT_398185 [Tulosesus angulatus]
MVRRRRSDTASNPTNQTCALPGQEARTLRKDCPGSHRTCVFWFSFDEPHTCPCDNSTIESREHVLAHCPRFERWRQPLRDVSPGIALSEILGTVDGIAALEAFLRTSGAFARPIDTPTRAPSAEPTTAPDEHLDNG